MPGSFSEVSIVAWPEERSIWPVWMTSKLFFRMERAYLSGCAAGPSGSVTVQLTFSLTG